MRKDQSGSIADFSKSTGVRTFEIVQYITAPLEGDIEQWPSNIQDRIYEALEKKSNDVELPLKIVASYCAIDYGENTSEDRPYLHIIASEIVAVDDRFFTAQKELLRNLIADIVSGRRTH